MKVSPVALAFTALASRNASPIRAFSNAATVLLHSSNAADVKRGRSLAPSTSCPSAPAAAAAAAATARAMSSTAEASSTAAAAPTAPNPLLECTDLPKFSVIEPSQLTPAMTSILEKLEADFAALEAKMGEGGKEVMEFEEVLPVVERMQHPLGELRLGIPSRLPARRTSSSSGGIVWIHPPASYL